MASLNCLLLSISNNFLLSGAILSGKHEDSERYISPSNSSGFLLELKQKNRKFEYAFQLGFISESNSIMGSYLTGGYGLSNSSTYYSGINFYAANVSYTDFINVPNHYNHHNHF